MDGRRFHKAASLRRAVRLERLCHVAQERPVTVRAVDGSFDGSTTGTPAPTWSPRVVPRRRDTVDPTARSGVRPARGAAGESTECRRSRASPYVLFAPVDARRSGAGHPGARRTSGSDDDAAVHASEPGGN